MLLKRQSECATVYLVVAVFLALHPTQMEAATLRRTEKRDGRKEPTASSIREGVILFGKAPKNASLDDDTSYQADFTGFHKGKVFDVSSKEAQWKRMSPSLLCGSDHMKFRAVGSPVKYLALNQHPPMPLSHMPTTCGYNMHSHPFGLVMDVPYGGCYVVHEHGHYHLQLLWNGIPVTLICPKLLDVSATASPVTDYPFTLPWHQPTAVAPQDPTYPQVPPGFHHSPYFQYLFQLLPKTGQNSAHWQFQNQNHWHHLHHKTSQSTSSPQDAANVYNLYQQLLQQNQATTTTASPQDQASMQAKLSYLYQMLQQNQGYTTPFPQDQSSMLAYFYYLNQLLQQNQTSTASPQNSASGNAYLHYLYHLLQKHNYPTATPQDPLFELPKGMSPYFYHLLKHLYKAKGSTTAMPQWGQHLGSHMYPWLYANQGEASGSSDQSKSSYMSDPYWYSLYASQASTGAATTAPPSSGHVPWYGQGKIPWWFPGQADQTTASPKPSKYGQFPMWYPVQQTTAMPTIKAPGQWPFNPVEVSQLQSNFGMSE